MERIITGSDMKKIDRYTIDEIGIPSMVLMERAALSVVNEVTSDFEINSSVCCVCGVGNNGADGVAVARILNNKDYNTSVVIVGDIAKATPDFVKQLSIYKNTGGKVFERFDDIQNIKMDLFVDALFGVGLSRNVEGKYAEVINCINELCIPTYAVDIPSGINADNGMKMNVAIKANKTITFGCLKTGHLYNDGKDYCGKVISSDIGFPVFLFDDNNSYKVIEVSDYRIIPKRYSNSNKGTYGKVLVVAGCDTMSGAAYMCGLASFRMGVGMVKIFTTKGNETYIKNNLPEAMLTTYQYGDDYTSDTIEMLKNDLEWCDTVVAGPGFGTGKLQINIIKEILENSSGVKNIVFDADAINNISENDNLKLLLKKSKCNIVVTPHIGEMSKFADLDIPTIKLNHIEATKKIACEYGITVILKDSVTTVTDGKECYVNVSGNSGMATAGSGDVLAGITGAMVSKDMPFTLACAMAAFIHGVAGDFASKKASQTYMMATDIIEELKNITNIFDDKQEARYES
ncbi:MAG: NAD(P)H-hydrate dehydratase [Lachnospiraceae bacterium]|nr:NAD(P)H-hydrate dehydratase [Lachnospiraceae bacterium]